MTRARCPECGERVRVPNGLALSGRGDNPDWKGVSCPRCDDGAIPVDNIRRAFGCGEGDP